MKLTIVLLVCTLCLSGCSSFAPAETTQTTAIPETTQATTTPETTQATTTPETTTPQPTTGWQVAEGKTVYLREDGSRHTGWLELDGKRYYFDSNGYQHTGWLEKDGKTYYLLADGAAQGLVEIEGISYHFDHTGARMIMVNPWNTTPEDYAPSLVYAENGYQVSSVCYDALMKMLSDCRSDGYNAQITSAYRDHETQIWLYDRKVNYYLSLGYSTEDAKKEAGTIIAVPGTSEHELGLALDLVDNSYWGLDEAQENTPAQKWLMEHCWDYGFILRYPNEKSEKTGIIYEPWHYRYVGIDISLALKESGMCLEEYIESLSK